MQEQWGHCARHPEVETGLRCGRCETPICVRCQVQSPVGPRCPDCAQVRRLPTFDVTSSHYLRASLAGFGTALVAGALFWLLVLLIPFLGLLSLVGLAGIGYAIGEAVSVGANRKRGQGLRVIAGAATGFSYLVISLLGVYLFGSLFVLLAMGIGVYIATTRVR